MAKRVKNKWTVLFGGTDDSTDSWAVSEVFEIKDILPQWGYITMRGRFQNSQMHGL
jgi:hypothetical protein